MTMHYPCTWQLEEAQRKLTVVPLHTHSFTSFQTLMEAWLPLKIIHKHEATSLTTNIVPFPPWGCQYLCHKNPMPHTHRKVNCMPIHFHFYETDGIRIDSKNKKTHKTGEGILKCWRISGDYILREENWLLNIKLGTENLILCKFPNIES